MTRCLMCVVAVGLVFAGVAGASVKQGDTELDFLAGFTTQNGVDSGPDFDMWFASASLGYFLTDNIQVQAAAMGALTKTEFAHSSIDVDVWGIGGRAKYHFMPTNQLVPYIGAQLMWVTADVDTSPDSTLEGTTDGTLWGPLVGARYELNEHNDLYVEYQYQIWEGDVGDVLDDGHTILLGIIHQFK